MFDVTTSITIMSYYLKGLPLYMFDITTSNIKKSYYLKGLPLYMFDVTTSDVLRSYYHKGIPLYVCLITTHQLEDHVTLEVTLEALCHLRCSMYYVLLCTCICISKILCRHVHIDILSGWPPW